MINGKKTSSRAIVYKTLHCLAHHDDILKLLVNAIEKQGVSQCGLIAIFIKKYLKAKENYENSNISPCKNIIFNKIV
jgi:hypothetical protein